MSRRASIQGDGELLTAKIPVDNVEIRLTVSVDDARRIVQWSPSIVRLNLGYEVGPPVQYALAKVLDDLDG